MNTPTQTPLTDAPADSASAQLAVAQSEVGRLTRERDEANVKGQERVMETWLRCLGDQVYPKAHHIDALGKTTRRLTEDRNAAQKELECVAKELQSATAELATLRRERDELRAELLTTHQMACRVGLERDELAKLLETECNTLQVELVEAERKFQDGFDCVPFCELSSAANALLSRIRAALQSLRALTEQPGKP